MGEGSTAALASVMRARQPLATVTAPERSFLDGPWTSKRLATVVALSIMDKWPVQAAAVSALIVPPLVRWQPAAARGAGQAAGVWGGGVGERLHVRD